MTMTASSIPIQVLNTLSDYKTSVLTTGKSIYINQVIFHLIILTLLINHTQME